MTNTDLDAVVAAVRERIDPDEAERRALADAAADLESRVHDALADLPVDAGVLQVGSTARGTWLSGDRDIDLFVRFPDDLSREELEEYGLTVGHAVLPDGHEEYAEHPYVKGDYEGFDVDLVPCYDVPTAPDIRSAVDRTPFHNAYLTERLDDDLAAEVRVFKRFLKGIGAYGSDLRTEGFSGYLAELLLLEYGGFEALLRAAADWNPPVEFDPEDHGTRTFSDPLVVIDPTDPERNVAAVCSAENVARLQHYARCLLSDPREALFFLPDPPALDADGVRSHLERRGTTPVAIVFDAPGLVDDQLYPQLRKSLDGVANGLDRRGFDVFRKETFADDDAVLFLELSVAERPRVERHDGPPVHVRQHAEGFYDAYADGDDDYGPFLDGDRFVVEREREFTSATAFLTSDALFDVALGKHVESTVREDGYEVLVGDDVATLADAFGSELGRYFEPRP
ncbi:CCA tRNA nucleotidyltransferase [Haloferax sp. MBLA0076]|uniref:CCA-adding enzyme n=1 Tax=Haloferax litoreum TaxID=2666140 RepID=A0A6A8GDG5_9EURY|nr:MULTISPECIES: CCA tRNA nucleotidyltransferase [Haloferax]KAB1192431.1 CCA tRNA nucleotidyltransferase [Haloferax sp. CBA1148]MRX20899.1 CCA tRNA nucleotidyltransferase [Haloferax litoreum]